MTVKKYKYTFNDLNINPNSIALAMGYSRNSINDEVHAYIDEVMSYGEDLCKIEGGYRIIDSVAFDKLNFLLLLENQPFKIQKIVFNRINNSEKAALFVCTVGHDISVRSRILMKEGDIIRGYVYDTLGSIAVEAAMNLIQEKLKNEMSASGMKITNRYSPGYCGWDIVEQKILFSLLPKKFCGIELTDSCLMLPIKSLSGIIGIGRKVKYNAYTCNLCEMSNCLYRNLHAESI
jgi:hypothetical protein